MAKTARNHSSSKEWHARFTQVLQTSYFTPGEKQVWIWAYLWGTICVLSTLKSQRRFPSFQEHTFSFLLCFWWKGLKTIPSRHSPFDNDGKGSPNRDLTELEFKCLRRLLDLGLSLNVPACAIYVLCFLPLSMCLCDIHCREFGRWKVNSLALERQENNGFSLPLDPEFLQTIRQLGRRPSLGTITDNIIRKYGTHFLLSATLGGKYVSNMHLIIIRLETSFGSCPTSGEEQNHFYQNTKGFSIINQIIHSYSRCGRVPRHMLKELLFAVSWNNVIWKSQFVNTNLVSKCPLSLLYCYCCCGLLAIKWTWISMIK